MNAMNIALSGKLLLAGVLVCGVVGLPWCAQAAPKKVLVVTVTKGFRHSSIPTAEKVLDQLGKESHAFTVEYARVEPNDPRYQVTRAQVLGQLGQVAEAVAQAEKAVAGSGQRLHVKEILAEVLARQEEAKNGASF